MINEDKIILISVIILLSFIFLNYISISLSNLLYPYEVEQAEGFMPSRIKLLLTYPEYLYNDIYSYPYYFTNDYPPTFYIIVALFSVIFGNGFFPCRLVVFVSSMLIGLFIYKIVKMKTKNNYFSLISTLMFFSSYVIFYWGSISRVDIVSALFSLIGIYFILLCEKAKLLKQEKNYLTASVIFFILSVTTKQSYFIAPISAFIYLFLNDRKKSYDFLLLFSIPVLMIFFLLNLMTNGQFFLHTIVYNSKIILSQNGIDLVINLINQNLIVLLIAIVFSLKKGDLISIYFILSFSFGLLQAFKTGSATNCFIEIVITTSIILGVTFNTIFKRKVLFLFLILLLLTQIYVYVYFNNHILLSVLKPQKYLATRNLNSDLKILNYIKNNDGRVFIQNSMYSIANNGEIPFELWGIYDIPDGYVNITEFEEYFKSQNYTMILVNEHFYVFENLAHYVNENYRLIDTIDWYDNDYKNLPIYVYKLNN